MSNRKTIVEEALKSVKEDIEFEKNSVVRNIAKEIARAIHSRKEVIRFLDSQIKDFETALKDISKSSTPISSFVAGTYGFNVGGVDYIVTPDGIKPKLLAERGSSLFGTFVDLDIMPTVFPSVFSSLDTNAGKGKGGTKASGIDIEMLVNEL